MHPDQLADGADRSAVIEWNGGGTERPSRWSLVIGILRNRLLVPLLAGLGAVATFASLVWEWTVTSVDLENRRIPTPELEFMNNRLTDPGPFDLGAVATAYLVGVVVLASAAVLALFGAPAARRTVSLIGLGASGAILAIIVATHVNLDDSSRLRFYYDPNLDVQVDPGRGLMMAYAGTAALGLALLLTGRLTPARAESAVAAPVGDGPQPPAEAVGWPWRRPRTTHPGHDDHPHDPLDLTVTPTQPFARPE